MTPPSGGVLTTLPLGLLNTLIANWRSVNVALMFCTRPLGTNEQLEALLEHVMPPKPPNEDPTLGAASSDTSLPSKNASEQSVPQVMPAGVEVTGPAPFPVRVRLTSVRSRKLARTVVLAFGTRKV